MSASFLSTLYCDCGVVINEINLNNPKKLEPNEFIELKSTCAGDVALRSYKLIGFICTEKWGYLNLEVNLFNARMRDGYYTIGGNSVDAANINASNTNVKFQDKFIPKVNFGVFSSFRKDSTKYLNAIGLLYGDKETFNEFRITKETNRIRIDEKMIDIMKKYLVDLVIYGSDVPCDKCDLFERIYPDFANRDYTLREIRSNSNKNDVSINRCAIENDGFVPERFKLGDPTPGQDNDCAGPRFILENLILSAIPPVISNMYEDDYDDMNGACSSSQSCQNYIDAVSQSCTSSINPINYFQTTSQGIEQAVQAANESSSRDACAPLNLCPGGGNLVQSLVQENNRKRVMGIETDYSEELEWESTKFFR